MTICAWCDETIEAGPPAVAAPVSHGICRGCLDEKLAAAPAPRAQVTRAAPRRPSFALGPIPVASTPAPAAPVAIA